MKLLLRDKVAFDSSNSYFSKPVSLNNFLKQIYSLEPATLLITDLFVDNFKRLRVNSHKHLTAQKMNFPITDFFSKCDQIRSLLQIWSHLLKKSVMEKFIFCAVPVTCKKIK